MHNASGFSKFYAENRSAAEVLVSIEDQNNSNPMGGDHVLPPGGTLEVKFEGEAGRWFDWGWIAKNLSTSQVVSGHSGEWPSIVFSDGLPADDGKVRVISWGQHSADSA